MPSQAMLIMTTLDDEAAAARLAATLVEQRLAACVQQLDIQSHYRWQGAVKCDGEVLLLVKTSAEASQAAMRAIEENHAYDVPEIVCVPIADGLPSYLDWVAAQTSQ